MIIKLSKRADADIDSALEYLHPRNPKAADKVLADLEALFVLLASDNFDGPFAKLRTGETVRSVFQHPFHVLYARRGRPKNVVIIRVYHYARLPLTRR